MNKEENYKIPNSYQNLFKNFVENKIEWCHWKSNEHLSAGLLGKTDLDILFHDFDRIKVETLMHKNGFILFESPPYRSYPGIIDFISISSDTGSILHAHSHFKLTLGEKNLKSFIFPWSKFILDRRKISENYSNVFVSNPTDELILLIIRYALKLRKNSDVVLSKGFLKEFFWLKHRINIDDVRSHASDILTPDIANLIIDVINHDDPSKFLCKLSKILPVYAREQGWRRLTNFDALFSRIWREISVFYSRVLGKINKNPFGFVKRRVLVQDGIIVAFMGVDGSGKSTITESIVSEWKEKIDISYVYMGAGDGPQSFAQQVLKKIYNFLYRLKNQKRKEKISKNTKIESSHIENISWARIILGVLNVLHKKNTLKRMMKLKNKGHIVLCDRWPQNKYLGINDGPMLSVLENSSNIINKYIYKWEKKNFDYFSSIKIDKKIFLNTPINQSLFRKPCSENKKKLLLQKIKILNDLFKEGIDCKISTDKNFNTVLLQCKTEIWKTVQDRNKKSIRIVECLGLPGIGKTTVASKLAGMHNYYSRNKLLKNVNQEINLISFLQSTYKHPLLYSNLIYLIIKYYLWTSKKSITYLLRIPTQLVKLNNIKLNKDIFADQLFLQNIWSGFVAANINKINPLDLVGIISRIYKNKDTSVMFFNLPIEEISQRLKNRAHGNSEFDSMSSDLFVEKFKDNKCLLDIKRACYFSGLNVFDLDASADTDSIVSNIENYLNIKLD
jgi:thymidylate kinase